LDKKKVGKAIAYLRKRAGYTQKDLADRIGISDKAVSKWERGLGLPDITYLGKLSILLDTDTDSLLSGDVIHHDKEWCGLLILPNNICGVTTGTIVYDKPMVYYLLSYFLLVGIRHIYIVCNKSDQNYMENELGNGEKLSIHLNYCGNKLEQAFQSLSDTTNGHNNVMTVFGRSFIYGVDQTRFFQRAMSRKDKFTILSLPKKIEQENLYVYGKVKESNTYENNLISFNDSMKVVMPNSEEKIHTQYDYYQIPILFCPKYMLSELFTVNDSHVYVNISRYKDKQIYTEVLDRGYVEMPMNNSDQILDVSSFVRLVQNACGMKIYCLEEIAWRRGMITLDELRKFGEIKHQTKYGQYIISLTKKYENEIKQVND